MKKQILKIAVQQDDEQTQIFEYDLLEETTHAKYRSISYTEEDGTKVVCRIGKQSIHLKRTAKDMVTTIVYKQGERLFGHIQSVYGEIPIDVETTVLDIKGNEVKLVYHIHQGETKTTFHHAWTILEESYERN